MRRSFKKSFKIQEISKSYSLGVVETYSRSQANQQQQVKTSHSPSPCSSGRPLIGARRQLVDYVSPSHEWNQLKAVEGTFFKLFHFKPAPTTTMTSILSVFARASRLLPLLGNDLLFIKLILYGKQRRRRALERMIDYWPAGQSANGLTFQVTFNQPVGHFSFKLSSKHLLDRLFISNQAQHILSGVGRVESSESLFPLAPL